MTVAIKHCKLNSDDIDLIGKLIKSKMAPCRIARKFGVKTDDIRRICTALGLPPTGYRVRKDYTVINDKIRHMVKSERYSQQYIADALQVDKARVLAIQVELGYAIEGKLLPAKKSKMESLAKKVSLLRRDGMTIADACRVVGGISTATYTRYKSAEKKASVVSRG